MPKRIFVIFFDYTESQEFYLMNNLVANQTLTILVKLRASPRVYHILLGISCVLPTYKKICQIKKELISQFGIIYLPNPDLTYIRNPERETELYLCPSTS